MRSSTLRSCALFTLLSLATSASALAGAPAATRSAQGARPSRAPLRGLLATAFVAGATALGTAAHAQDLSYDPTVPTSARVESALDHAQGARLFLPAGLSYHGKLDTGPVPVAGWTEKNAPQFQLVFSPSVFKNPLKIRLSPTETLRFKISRHRVGVTYEWQFNQSQLF